MTSETGDAESQRNALGEAIQPLPVDAKPLVSVIVRSVGRAVLREALASVAAQTYPNIEVVVVDALGHGHPTIPARCGSFPARLCGRAVPLPRARAANVGLDEARGRYLIFLDDDDRFDPDHIAGLVGALESRPEGQVAYAGVRGVDASGTVIRVFKQPFSPVILRSGNYIPLHAALFSRELVRSGCRFDETLDVYEDWDFFLQLATRTAFVHVDRVTASYQVGGHSKVGLSPDASAQRQGRARVFEKWKHLWSGEEIDEVFTTQIVRPLDQPPGLHELCARIDEDSARIAALEGTLARVLHSRSWALTAPLRWLAIRARELARRIWCASWTDISGSEAATTRITSR